MAASRDHDIRPLSAAGARVIAGLLLGGCAAQSVPPADTSPPTAETTPDPCGETEMEISGGFGDTDDPFEAAPQDGSTVVMVHHPDGGGWYVDTAVRVAQAHDAVRITPRIRLLADGRLISGATDETFAPYWSDVLLQPDGTCSGTASGIRAYLWNVVDTGFAWLEDICPLAGEEVEVSWEVEDIEDGRTASASVRAFLALDSLDEAPCAAL